MSSVFSKSREKRSRSSSNETNNSFVKNVTSRVSGLLPSTITKWFSSPSSSNANGSAPTADATDSSTEDEASEPASVIQPPTKRMRFNPNTPGTIHHYATPEPNCAQQSTEKFVLEPVTPYGSVQSPPGRTTFRRETNYVSTPFPNRSSEDVLDGADKDSTMFKSQHTVSTIGSSVAPKRKSLFDLPGTSEASIRACAKTACNTRRDPKQPCFKPSLLGSPFYPGRTMYGGASSSYINSPNIRDRKTPQVKEANTSDNTISHSTRRIMDLLEHYSSPLNEARRIPQYTRKPRTESFESSVSSKSSSPSNKIVSYKTQELHVPSIATLLRLKQRSRLMDTTTAARQIIASHSSTVDFSPYPSRNMTPEKREQPKETETSNNNSKFTTKVKTKISTPKRRENIVEMEMPEPVILPSVTLQIDQNNLPKFTLGTIEPPKTKTPAMSLAAKKEDNTFASKTTETAPRKPDTTTTSSFKFSSPVKLSTDEPQSSANTPPKFTFGSPERRIERTSESKDVSFVGTKEVPQTAAKQWKCPDCWVDNKPDAGKCVCCGYAKPIDNNKKPAKCTVCKLADSQPNADKCVNCEKVTVNNKPAVTPKVNSAQWKCDDCWVSNDEAAEKCVCCGGRNPKKSTPAKSSSDTIKEATPKIDSSKWKCEDCWVSNDEAAEKCVCCGGSNPKKTAPAKPDALTNDAGSDWKCDVCWIKNKSSLDKCAACGGSKPGTSEAKQPAPPPTNFFNSTSTNDSAFKALIKKQTDKWECPGCLVHNDSDKLKCACCEAEKPGTVNEAEKKSFNFGINANTTFKFGIDPKAQEAPKTEAKPVESKKEQETNNNVLSKTPSFSFGIPKKLDEPVAAKKEETEAPKVSFSFGIPKSTPAPTVTVAPAVSAAPVVSAVPALPIFGILPKPAAVTTTTTEEEKEKPQEVPKVDFSILKSPETPKVTTSLFGAPVNSTPEKSVASPFSEKNPTVTATFVLNPSGGLTEKKETSQAASKAETPKPAFTFGSGGLTLASNLFATPTAATTSLTTSISFGTLVQSTLNNTESLFKAPEPTATPTISANLFTVPKVDGANSVSLFQKSEVPATTAPPALAATAPLFNFGNNAQVTAQPQTEKPKFNFTFGSSNKTENTSVFKPAFGATGAGNALGGNGLSTGNIIPTGNGINAISGNEIAANPLTNNMQGGLFGAQKENMWSTTNSTTNNMFAPNTNTTSAVQKPATFSFGSSTGFNPSNGQTTSTPFNSNTPAFGTSTPASNVFGMGANNGTSMFGQASQPAGNVFGTPPTNPAPSLFGSPSVGATPTFGTPNPSIPTFETPSLTPAPAPTFNFGAPQSTGVFGFGGQQQQQQQQPQQGQQSAFGAASFGAAAPGSLQFNIGATAPPRRVRRAMRRNQPR